MNAFPNHDLEISIDSKIRSVAFVPGNEHQIISCEETTGVQLRSLENQLMGRSIDSSTGALVVATSKDGRWIVTGTTDGLAIWDQSWSNPRRQPINGVRAIDISADSKWVVTGSDARTVDVWDLATGERRPGPIGQIKHEYNVVAVKFCPCGERLATATLFGSIRIYSTTTGKKLLTIPVSVTANLSGPNTGLVWFSSPRRLFVVAQGHIKCLNSDDGSVIYQWPMRRVSSPSSIAISPNSKMIAYCANDVVTLRNIVTREQIGDTLKVNGNVSCLAFSPGNRRLVAGSDTKFITWDLEKLITDASLFEDLTEPMEVCTHQDMPRAPPPTFILPLMSITNEAVKPWLHSFFKEAEEALSKEAARPSNDYNVFANRALMRGRLGRLSEALEDAEQSLRMQTSAIGQIAKTITLIKLKQYEAARQEAQKVPTIAPVKERAFLLEVIRKILSCLAGDYEGEHPTVTNLSGDRTLLLLVQANMHLSEEKFDPAMQSFKNAHVPVMFPYDETPEMRTISYIFGWKFNGLGVQIMQKKCDHLLAAGLSQAAHLFLEVMDTYHREIVTHVELSDWAIEFRRDGIKRLESIGDKAMESKEYKKAAEQYTAVIALVGEPDAKHSLLLKRSGAHVAIGPKNYQDALLDADEAVRLNSYSPWGYEKRHLVLYKMHHYHEAAEALDKVFSCLEYSTDKKSADLRAKGVNVRERRKIIMDVVEDTFNGPRPHMLINTESGRLCEKQQQMEAYRADPAYRDLVLTPDSPVGKVGAEWQESVRKYFHYSTLSHTWEEAGELEFRDVEPRTLDKLTDAFPSFPKSLSTTKLQTFCKKSRDHGYFWAWSDTCCINKAEKEVVDAALRSMYRWYSESSLTIVHLRGVLRQLPDGDVMSWEMLDELLKDFVGCRWNQRAWTLQEYFASNVIHFYTEDWKPYLPIGSHASPYLTNHKTNPAIQRGMQLVTELNAEELKTLKPGTDEARQKLRLASTRKATRKEDIAYSLLGIFKVTIETVYGDDEVPRALGRLLGALLSQSSDVSILAWSGKSSEYNSCLPGEITVYKEPESRYIPDPIEEAKVALAVMNIRSTLSPTDLDFAIKLHNRLLGCPLPEILHGRLKLSCIVFPVEDVSVNATRNGYTATVSLLGEFDVKTTEEFSSSRGMVLVHPWFRHLLSPGISMSDHVQSENAARLVAGLRQPFGAILLALNRTAQDYKRIVTDQLITVQIQDSVSPEQLLENMRELYIR